MRLSKLQRRILELALEAYEQPAILVVEADVAKAAMWGLSVTPGTERGDSFNRRSLRVRDLVEKIYGVTLGGRWFRWEKGEIYAYPAHNGLSLVKRYDGRCNGNGGYFESAWFKPSTDDERRRYRAGAVAVSRAVTSLIERGLIGDYRRIQLTELGAKAIRDAKQNELAESPRGDSINNHSSIVTQCPCGAPLDAQRSTRRYCSAACRQAAYRVRQG